MSQFDLHVATESYFPTELEHELKSIGVHNDALLTRHVNFYGNVQVSACPLIGLHVTKKYDCMPISAAIEKVRQDLNRVEILLRNHQVVGYAHGEVTHDEFDATIQSNGPFNETPPWPVKPFAPTMSRMDKKWDIHIAIPLDALGGKLAGVLESSGMYSIDVRKRRNGYDKVFRIYTVQGLSSSAQGMKLYAVLHEWFQRARVPYVEIKQETYVGMIRVGNPAILPPTIAHVDFIDGSCLRTLPIAAGTLGA